ncbi:NAD/FAD-utilizing enzyme apparently involved in cell division [hydrothermal vent metagenome]|uniref:NAD/FAD-utilizing enzyme apparently involved in cell division n=1 Tax=hydrothermal vent metagenome TaxID=652676 RepID=A0A3B0WQ81_9ZZZZ
MKRHYFISDDLDDLDRIEVELEQKGIKTPQIHVLSKDDGAIAKHEHLHNIESVLKQNVVHGTIVGAMFGLLGAAAVMAIGYLTTLPETYTWMPFYFLAVVMFGFITWSGGFYGIQTPHKDFRRFQKDLNSGKHIFIIDVDASQEGIVKELGAEHPHLVDAGTGSATPRWVVMGQQNVKDFTSSTFP